ncbi:Putative AC9 transposase, partial [Linum perenne]
MMWPIRLTETIFPKKRDVLGVPISSVASESAFSTGGRVLSNFRSSLTPAIVEALICAEDWLRSTSPDIFDPEEEEYENEQLEFEKGFEDTILKFDATPSTIGSDPLVQPVLQSFMKKNGNDNDNAIDSDDDNDYNE